MRDRQAIAMKSQENIAEYLRTLKFKKTLGGWDPEAVLCAFKDLDALYREYCEDALAQAKSEAARSARELSEATDKMAVLAEALGLQRGKNEALAARNRQLEDHIDALYAERKPYKNKTKTKKNKKENASLKAKR